LGIALPVTRDLTAIPMALPSWRNDAFRRAGSTPEDLTRGPTPAPQG